MGVITKTERTESLRIFTKVVLTFGSLTHWTGTLLFLVYYGQYVLHYYCIQNGRNPNSFKVGADIVKSSSTVNALFLSRCVNLRNNLMHGHIRELTGDINFLKERVKSVDVSAETDEVIVHGLALLKKFDWNIMYDFINDILDQEE